MLPLLNTSIAVAFLLLAKPSAGLAQSGAVRRIVELSFVPTHRAQLALWIESEDGTLFRTVRLTQSVAYRGIGNRPGALQMNSGFHWPYGRRRGVLPVWAHRRLQAGGEPFRTVIFQDRAAEGWASRSTPDASPDDYYCLSFDADRSGKDQLDAVSCASVFNSDKGRYITAEDVALGYGEPWQHVDGEGTVRALPLHSPYPPRRDVRRCTQSGCDDHADVSRYAEDARAAMPEIDAVTMATPTGDARQTIRFTVPEQWPDGRYLAWVEAHVEGDYNPSFNADIYPTPTKPEGLWDSWARTYGYPYRGQPSVVYKVPFDLAGSGEEFSVSAPAGMGELHGLAGTVHPADATLTDDPDAAPGSGADRLRLQDGARLRVRVGRCDATTGPAPVDALQVVPYPDPRHAHQWARMSFRVPTSPTSIGNYEVRVSHKPIADSQSFERAVPANAATLESVELVVPTGQSSGTEVTVDLGGLNPETEYWIGIRAVDLCNVTAPVQVATVTTEPLVFTTVSPCFVATAAYGSPMAEQVQALRRVRDQHLMPNPIGRAFVSTYYALGPYAARMIEPYPVLRALARTWLRPCVGFAHLLP